MPACVGMESAGVPIAGGYTTPARRCYTNNISLGIMTVVGQGGIGERVYIASLPIHIICRSNNISVSRIFYP